MQKDVDTFTIIDMFGPETGIAGFFRFSIQP